MFDKWKNRAASDLILIISGVLVVFIIPEFSSLPTGCLFNKTTGFYCAGCGISRGIHTLLRGNIINAMHHNLLIFTLFPLSVLWYSSRFFDSKYSLKIKKYDKSVIAFFIITVLIFTILRNIPSPCFDFIRPHL